MALFHGYHTILKRETRRERGGEILSQTFRGNIQATWAWEESSGKLIGFLTCQSNPDPPLRGSRLLAFSLQFVMRLSLHFDLIRPIGIAPNKNQSSGLSKRGSGQRRRGWLAQISAVRANSLTPSPLAAPTLLSFFFHTWLCQSILVVKDTVFIKGFVCLHDCSRHMQDGILF